MLLLALAWAASRDHAGLVLVQFVAPDRPLCRRTLEETLVAAAVREELARGWELVLVDAEQDTERFREILGEGGVLASVALAPGGEPLAAWRGFAAADALAAFLARTREEAEGLLALHRAAERGRASGEEEVALAEALAARALYMQARAGFERALAAPACTGPTRARAELGLAELALARGENLEVRRALGAARAALPDPSSEQRARLELLDARLAVLERRAAPD